MHTLSRQVRFTLDPFKRPQGIGSNSYASKTCVGGLGVHFSLWVDLASPLNPDTGFVVNVSQIDQIIRQGVVPLFSDMVYDVFGKRQIPSFNSIIQVLNKSWAFIDRSFQPMAIMGLSVELDPYRKISIQSNEAKMFRFSEKFEFSAMHRLWNDKFDEAKNFELFGKCANPAGHGHNYILDVSVEKTTGLSEPEWQLQFEKDVKENFLDLVDHKNLNIDVPEFSDLNPTVENLSSFAWQKLEKVLKNAKLKKVVVWENDRTYCSYEKSD
ncbi:MAG: 6-pyruvoyl trahydropterin synthase family protein [Planctomycetota bacterium]|jgi:6-pyruvoyltetrahydropterin/6-carboxytetrahydropterin synthase